MTSGAYLLSDHDGPYALERFTCGRTGGGWSYEAVRTGPTTGSTLGRLEVHLDAGAVRLHAEAGGWVLRGAAAGGQVLWRRGEQERTAGGDGFTGSSPAHLVVAAQLGRERLQLVEVTEPVLATRVTTQRWRRLGEQDRDGVSVASWQVEDLATGDRRVVRLAGDVVVEAPGVVLQGLRQE